jgi:predicted transcriptional regulator
MANQERELSRRERQIMDVLYARGQAGVADVVEALDDPPSYSAVRALLNVLERKGHVKHVKQGTRYVYSPTRPRSQAGRTALKRVLETFYRGSVENAVAGLLEAADTDLDAEELDRLAKLVERARKEQRS